MITKCQYSMSFLFIMCFGIFLSSIAQADICFLPSMECADANAGTGGGGGEPSCYGYDSEYKSRASGWECEGPCNGKYKCSCSVKGFELRNGQCVKKEDPCIDYTYTSDKGGCEKCTDSSSGNYGKWKCECTGIIYNGECVEDPCDSSYNLSSSQASSMRAKGYTCAHCTASYSEYYNNYACNCPSPNNVDDTGACVEPKDCSGMYDTKADCDRAINGESHKVCEPKGECYDWVISCASNKGEYKTQMACESANYPYACRETSDGYCYVATNQTVCLYTDTEIGTRGYSCDSCVRDGQTYYGNCTCTKEFEQPKDTSGIVYCYNCSDEDDRANPCYGKYHCQGGGRMPEGEVTCSCPYRADGRTEDSDTKYYERCMVNEDCFEEHLWNYEAYTWCYASARPSAYGDGYYNAGKKCTRKTDNKDVNWYVPCTARADCWGNPSPAAGKKNCSNNQGIVKLEDGTTTTQGVECGNKLYFDECTGCNDEYYQEGEKYCHAFKKSSQEYYSNHGYYFVKSKCGTGDDEIVYMQKCDSLFKNDCDGKPTIAYGLKECEEGYGVGTPVECGGSKYYESCSGCKVPSSKSDGKGNTCWASLASNCNRNTEEKCIYQGYYWIEDDTCQEEGKVKYVYYAECDDDHCAGRGPAYGMHICPAGSQPDQSKKIVKCGGNVYAESCLAECSYNYTDDSRITDETKRCPEGQTFVPKCNDNNDPPITWGECK